MRNSPICAERGVGVASPVRACRLPDNLRLQRFVQEDAVRIAGHKFLKTAL
jgi:hypothetical protein